MARTIAALCAERHYMGASSNGRFSTDRSVRPDYDRRPSTQTLARWNLNREANQARYLRDQNVVGLVLAAQDARDDLAAGTARLAELASALEAARTHGDVDQQARLEDALSWLQTHLDEALENRRSASQRLRLIGISPKQEALIRAEAQRRRAEAAQA